MAVVDVVVLLVALLPSSWCSRCSCGTSLAGLRRWASSANAVLARRQRLLVLVAAVPFRSGGLAAWPAADRRLGLLRLLVPPRRCAGVARRRVVRRRAAADRCNADCTRESAREPEHDPAAGGQRASRAGLGARHVDRSARATRVSLTAGMRRGGLRGSSERALAGGAESCHRRQRPGTVRARHLVSRARHARGVARARRRGSVVRGAGFRRRARSGFALLAHGIFCAIGHGALAGLAAATSGTAIPALLPIAVCVVVGLPAARRLRATDRRAAHWSMIIAGSLALATIVRNFWVRP